MVKLKLIPVFDIFRLFMAFFPIRATPPGCQKYAFPGQVRNAFVRYDFLEYW